MDTLELLSEITNAFGPSGFEDDVVAIARGYAPTGADLQEDSLRNLYIRRPQDSGSARPVVMLDAHTDEVGFMVKAIRPNGLLQIVPLGGWSGITIPAHRVLVRSKTGVFCPGIVASKPPHYLSESERNAAPSIQNMSIDVGATSDKEVAERFRIGVGAPVIPDTVFEYNSDSGIMMGKAFDCRAGCACVLRAMEALFDEDLDVVPVGALAAQEEVGLRGARVTARTVAPDVAIVFEGVPADDTFAEGWAIQTALKKGPMLRHIDSAMITNPRFMRLALEVAREHDIPVQEAVRDGGGTNAGAIHLSGQGVPTIVIDLPVRYVHTHYGYAALEDFENCVALGVHIIRRLSRAIVEGF